MRRPENRCVHCGGKFGLVSYYHWRLRFCRKSCRSKYIAKSARERTRMTKWLRPQLI